MTDPPDPKGLGSEDDAAIVLEAIDFMMGLGTLDAEARHELEQIRQTVTRLRKRPDRD